MSLTKHLNDRESPVHQFFAERFPRVEELREDWLLALHGSDTLEPPGPVHWSTVGTAIDYRLRFYFDGSPKVAQLGMALLSAPFEWSPRDEAPPETGTDWGSLRGELTVAFGEARKRLGAMGRRLSPDEEELMCRYSYAFALFDQLVRAGLAVRSPLYQLGRAASVDAVLSIASDTTVDDLRQLSWGFYETQQEMLMSSAFVLNPVFTGSNLVGGADADMIVDRCLVEFKTTMTPTRRLRDACWQLLGYTLLDFDDEFLLSSVGIYLPRQQRLVRWPLSKLMQLLSHGQHTNLSKERKALRTLLVNGSGRVPTGSGPVVVPGRNPQGKR